MTVVLIQDLQAEGMQLKFVDAAYRRLRNIDEACTTCLPWEQQNLAATVQTYWPFQPVVLDETEAYPTILPPWTKISARYSMAAFERQVLRLLAAAQNWFRSFEQSIRSLLTLAGTGVADDIVRDVSKEILRVSKTHPPTLPFPQLHQTLVENEESEMHAALVRLPAADHAQSDQAWTVDDQAQASEADRLEAASASMETSTSSTALRTRSHAWSRQSGTHIEIYSNTRAWSLEGETIIERCIRNWVHTACASATETTLM